MLFTLVSELDKEENKDGIGFEQFLCTFTTDLVNNLSPDHIGNIFRMIDGNNKGTIRLDDLQKVVKETGETVSTEELREMIKRIGADKDAITFDEFYAIMSRKQVL